MSFDFLWQNVVWVIVGVIATRGWIFLQTRVRRRRLRRFFGADALGEAGITITVPILDPLTSDPFDASPLRTVGLKTFRKRTTKRWPIYGRVMHLDDYTAAEEILSLLRAQGSIRYGVLPDSDSLGRWATNPCMLCLGSPFVNATFSELIHLAIGPGGPLISAERASDTLDSYRVLLGGPAPMRLGVTDENAIGVIACLRNPSKPSDAAIGVWGCRSESTLATARYLKRDFKSIAARVEPGKPLVLIIAVRGGGLDICEPMLAVTDRVVLRRDELLALYQSAGAAPAAAAAAPATPAP